MSLVSVQWLPGVQSWGVKPGPGWKRPGGNFSVQILLLSGGMCREHGGCQQLCSYKEERAWAA